MNRTRLLLLASSLALAGMSPTAAQPGSAAPASTGSAVQTFAPAQAEAPVWIKDQTTRAAAQKFALLLRNGEMDGFGADPALASAVEEALARGQPADDKLITDAWVKYVQRLKSPVAGISYGDPALALQTPSPQSILDELKRAPSLEQHVAKVAAVNPFYAALRDTAVREGASADTRVRATLDRLRVIPAAGRAIVIDVASARLWMLEDGRAIDSMKVVVGRRKTPTPLLAGTIHYVTFNPYWNIPHDVASNSVAPLVLKRGVKYLKAARYVTADGFSRKAELVDAASIDWKAVADGTAQVHLRQLPGPNNMMGKMKFGFVNDYDIFLHDTPRRHLFAKEDRAYSMGCIRLEHADRLARWLLGRDVSLDNDEPEQHVQVDKGVPVFVTSLTAGVEDGKLTFAKDVYGLDPAPAPEPSSKLEVAGAPASD